MASIEINVEELKRPFKKVFKSDDSKFILGTGLKVMGISLIVFSLAGYLMWLMIAVNNVFFEANGFLGIADLKQAFLDYVLHDIVGQWYYFATFFVTLFFMGCYIGKILLRPFEVIGDYSHNVIENMEEGYNPDLFSEFKILTRFSEFFFKYLYDCRKSGKMGNSTIPPQFTKIHTPTFDKVFFFHFSLFVFMLILFSISVTLYMTSKIHGEIVEMAVKTLKPSNSSITYFLNNQAQLFNSIQTVTVGSIILGYFFLSFHLYAKVAGAAFGFFSTMRSFMKGNYKARVHLVGYYHIRPHSRRFNKYLDFVSKTILTNDQKQEEGKKPIDLKAS